MKSNLNRWNIIALFLLFLFGGLGLEYDLTLILSASVIFLLLVWVYLQKGKINTPKHLGLYLLFLFVLFSHSIFISIDTILSLKYSLLFATGGMVWLFSYNNKKSLVKSFQPLLILLSLTFGTLYLLHNLTKTLNPSHLSLFMPITGIHPHNHLGDLWSIVLVLIFVRLLEKKSMLLNSVIILAGVFFLFISQSRSAYLSFIAGLFYVFYKGGYLERYKKVLFFSFILFLFLFLFSGVSKSIFLNRPYYLQSAVAFFDYPLGIGLGNFGKISFNAEYRQFGLDGGSAYAHSFMFEVISAVGIFATVFFYWLYKIFKSLFGGRVANIPAVAVFIGITVNFLFDFTYFIPTMLWLWFFTLGLISEKGNFTSAKP